MKRWRWLLFLLLLTPTAGCVWDNDSDDNIEINVASYADFDDGGSWEYDDALSNDEMTITYEGAKSDVADYPGQTVLVLSIDSDADNDVFYFSQNLSQRLSLLGTADDGPFEEAIPLLRDDFEPDKTYGSYRMEAGSDCEASVSYHREDITVDGEYYDRAVRTTVTIECDGDLDRIWKFWFAKDEGLVQWNEYDGLTEIRVWELWDRDEVVIP